MQSRSKGTPRERSGGLPVIEPIEPRVLLHAGHDHDHAHSHEMFPKPPDGSQSPPPVVEAPAIVPLAPGDQLLPDVFPLISQSKGYVYGWTIDENEIPGRTLLRLTTAMANGGASAMELRGGTVNGDGTQNVHQRIYLEGGGFTDRLAGTFSYHAGHGHIHFDGFAAYHLRAVTAGNGVGSILASGDKVSFCLLDIDRYNPALPGSPANDVYISCGQVQGISVGWADVYDQSLDDQWIDVTGMSSGQYWLEVVSDPDNRLVESNESNNADRILINLTLPSADPYVTTHAPAGQSLVPASFIDFNFHERINTASFSIADDVASFTGPNGVNLLPQITGYAWSINDTRLRVTFNTQSAQGGYSMTLGPQILAFDNGNPMDQDGDSLPGEAAADRYTATFSVEAYVGPDGFGYQASATPLQNINLVPGAAGVFTIHNNADDSSIAVNLAANTFNFYGASFTGASGLFASTNGLITFGSNNSAYQNSNLSDAPSQRAIAPLWDDWLTNVDAADTVLGKFEDSDGNGSIDRLIVEWSQVRHIDTPGSPVTFQAILQLNTGATPGTIIFNYTDIDTGDPATSSGGKATVGIKDAGTQGARRLLLSYDTIGTTIATGRAVRIAFDNIAPTADVVDVAPDPRNTPVGQIFITFSERVTGLTILDHLSLQRDGGANLLTGAQTLSTTDNINWTLGNLAGLTGASGSYVLTVTGGVAPGPRVRDIAGNPLAVNATDAFTVDVTPPQVTSPSFTVVPSPQKLGFAFTENVAINPGAVNVLNLLNETSGAVIGGASIATAGSTLTVTFPGLPQGLPDGNYRARLLSGAVTDTIGNATVSHYDVHFFVLAGDANRDRYVDEADRAALDAHFGQSGTFADGDFDYSGTVDSADRAILDAAWRIWLPPQGALSLPGTGAADTYLLRLESASLVSVHDTAAPGAPPRYRVPFGALTSISFDGAGGADALVVDYSNGTPVPGFGVEFTGGAGDDTLTIVGTPAADVVTFTASGAQLAGRTTGHTGVERVIFAGNGGWDTVVADGGSSVHFQQLQRLQLLMIANGGTVFVDGGAGGLITRGLSLNASAKLDMADNDLLVDYGSGEANPYATIRQLIVSGRDSGFGILSAPGANDTVLAVADNALYNHPDWLGESIDNTAIVGKYTYYGDANLDGKVTSDDYVAIDVGLGVGNSWIQGDFNFSGTVTSDDYVAIDVNLGKGTAVPLAYAEEQSEMIAIHAEQFGGKSYIKAVEAAAAGKYKIGGKKPTARR